METLRFYPLDVRYKIEQHKAVIHLFGRTADGKAICVLDRDFRPYFVVHAEGDVRLEGLHVDDARIESVESFEKEMGGVRTRLLRAYVNLPKDVPKLRDHVRTVPGVKAIYEYDIPFGSRYLVDKGLTPCTLTEATGDYIPHDVGIPVFDATSLTTQEGIYDKPRVLAVDIETYNPHGKRIDPHNYPIVMLALYGDDFEKVLTWKRIPDAPAYTEVVDSESTMLERFAAYVREYQPDILVGYNSDQFDLPYIHTRAKKYKLHLGIGRDHSEMDVSGTSTKRVSIMGIAHIDPLPFIRRVVGRTMATSQYSLDAVGAELVGDTKVDVDIEQLAHYWDEQSPELKRYITYNLHDARLTYDIFFQIYPNMIELVKLIGQSLYDIVRMSFSQLVEWFLIKQAQTHQQVIPNKPRYRESATRMTQRSKGGFVYEPTPGIYENIAIFDFRSLYPTILISHNISPDTLCCTCCEGTQEAPVEGEHLWFCTKKQGFLSQVLKDIIERRQRIKELLKEDDSPLLRARSEALKVMAASFYGYLGFSMSRWYSFACVQSITSWGRQYINDVITKAEANGFQVVYGDTDSVFLALGDQTKGDAMAFVERINETLPGMMELEFEGLFPSGIFVSTKASEAGAKKRYALMSESGEIVVKGFEIVRRNFSQLGKDVQRKVLEILLGKKDVDLALRYVREKVQALKAGEIPIEELIISTQLTKNIEDYESVGPHVAAAKLMREQYKPVGTGSIIDYVITRGEGKIRDRVKLPENTTPHEVDADYYINHQILPSIERIFDVFGITKDQLVEESTQSSLEGYF